MHLVEMLFQQDLTLIGSGMKQLIVAVGGISQSGGNHFPPKKDLTSHLLEGILMTTTFIKTDHDPDFMEPSRLRPRLDYSDPAAHAHRYQDSFGAGNNLHSHDYYGSDYGEESYSSFYGNDHPYGGGYYY
ncbi:hypothetical protein TEA_029263 [Camellia sinensis var. sinensis]|uniref:Uncharacterized protein n=1 Tax=Camellia sinensis var. sinensis TaxID=542762 RepID=A0A4S4DNB2_CAMSN|nr:hypothetical protein TEA_029263 [Camellia sinensis var. sinensis]